MSEVVNLKESGQRQKYATHVEFVAGMVSKASRIPSELFLRCTY